MQKISIICHFSNSLLVKRMVTLKVASKNPGRGNEKRVGILYACLRLWSNNINFVCLKLNYCYIKMTRFKVLHFFLKCRNVWFKNWSHKKMSTLKVVILIQNDWIKIIFRKRKTIFDIVNYFENLDLRRGFVFSS